MQTLKEDIRRSILMVARKEFAEKGYAKASMRHIASVVGVRAGNLYNYFASKDNLFCTILNPVIDRLYTMLDKHHKDQDATNMLDEEYLAESVREYCSLIEGHRTLMEILLFNAQGSSLEHFKSDFTDRATEQVRQWIQCNEIIHKGMQINVSDFMIHLHTVSMFTMMEEILMHKIKHKDLQRIIDEYVKIETFGWQYFLQKKGEDNDE